MPKISIILPCYNVEKYLAKSIDSVLAQTFTDFELLIIIDGSPDNSQEIAKDYAKEDHRIKVLEKPNGGLSDARNYGLERAKGEFIYFMDSDDWIEPQLLEDNLKLIEDEQLYFVVFGYIQDNEDANDNLISSKEVSPKVNAYIKADPDLTIDSHHLGLLGYAWNKIYRKSFLDQHLFRFEKGVSLVEDILFNSKVYTVSNKIIFNQKSYYHYINREEETLMKTFHDNLFNLKKRKVKALKKFDDEWDFQDRKELLSISMIDGFRYCIHNLYSFKNQLSEKEKQLYVKKMLNDKLTVKLIADYPAVKLKDQLYKMCIQYKFTNAIIIFAKLFK